MADLQRYLTPYILDDLKQKMVFIGGARQVGKTTLATGQIASAFSQYAYYNWDYRDDRKKIITGILEGNVELLIFDEIHKYPKWKQFIKGEYDKYGDKYKFLITGSARLDIYRKGGDSLQGRYHYYRLHPLSLAELLNIINEIKPFTELSISSENHFNDLTNLFTYGGFPEVFLKQDQRFLRRWHNERYDRLFREDIQDMESIRDLGTMKLLGDLLPNKVASILSVNAIREDLEVSHRAITNWLTILESFYYHFRIYPFHKLQIRSIKKDSKIYMYDWSEIEDEAARFENMIASHLLKFVHFLYDYYGYKAELYFLRNVDKKEVDFLVTVDQKPWFCVEAKLNDTQIAPSLYYFRDRLNIPFEYQVINKQNVDIVKDKIRIVSADRFLSGLI